MNTNGIAIPKSAEGRWYDVNGNVVIDATIKQARGKYFASVTSVPNAVLRKFGIEEYQKNQIIQACIANPRASDETEESYIERVITASECGSSIAKNTGSAIHALAEGAAYVPELVDTIPQSIAQFRDWLVEHPGEKEKSVVSKKMKVAGRIDLFDDVSVYDYKSQFVALTPVRKQPSPKFYPEMTYQLAAYAEILRENDGKRRSIVSVIVSTNPEAQGIWIKNWTATAQKDGLTIFKAATRIFYTQRRYTK